MKQVLILGGSGGIGKSCLETFTKNSNYRLTTAQRQKDRAADSNHEMILGDLCEAEFRKELVGRTSPQVVISAFGKFPTRDSSVVDTINEFTLSVIELYEAFEAKGCLEHFVVISSLSGQINALPSAFMDEADYNYVCAKRMLSDFFRQAQLHMKSKSKIVLVEPGFVKTGFANIDARLVSQGATDILTRLRIHPINPEQVAKAIYHVVTDPDHPSTSLTFYNRSHDQREPQTRRV